MDAQEIAVKHIQEQNLRTDSLEVGNSKTGVIKVYGNADNFEEFQRKLTSMLLLREQAANAVLGGIKNE